MTKFTSTPDTKTVNTLWELYQTQKLVIQPPYQRRKTWTINSKILLIDSIYSNYDIPKFYLRTKTDKSGNVIYEVIDGQQRLRTLFDFRNGKLELNPNKMPTNKTTDQSVKFAKQMQQFVEEFYRKERKYPVFDDLTVDLMKEFNVCSLNVVTIDTDDDLRIKELFTRLNQNVYKLSDQDLRHAVYVGTNLLSSIIKLSYYPEKEPKSIIEADPGPNRSFLIMNKICSSNHIKTRRDEEFVSELLYLLIKGEPMDKKKKLEEFYEFYKNKIKPNGQEVRRFIGVLAEISSIFIAPEELKTTRFKKFTDFYTLFWILLTLKYGIIKDNKIMKKYVYTDEIKDLVKKIAIDISLKSKGAIQKLDEPFRDYVERSHHAGDTRDNRIWKYNFFIDRLYDNLQTKDEKRNFDSFIKMLLWHRQITKICKICNKPILNFNEAEVDHVKPWSLGGKTVFTNSQLSHSLCNKKKGKRV